METSGLDWRKNHIVGYAVCFGPRPQDSYYVPFRHLGDANVGRRQGPTSPVGWDDKKLAPGEAELIRELDRPGTLLFGHNLAFDLRMLAPVGLQLTARYEDTSINEPLLDEFVGRYSLESCAHRHKVEAKKGDMIKAYLRQKFPEIKADKDAMGYYWRLAGDDKVAVEYACGDGTTTWQLRDAQMVQIREQELELVHNVESRLIPVLARMMIRGVKVDEARLDWMLDPMQQGSIAHTIEMLSREFPDEFNPLSHNDVQAWMEKHGHTDWPHTPKGAPSFTSNWLENYEAGRKIIRLRKHRNLIASFVNPLKERHLHNGRVHTTFNQLRTDEFGTVTGRLSSNDPNMQQVPKHDEELGAIFRSAFIPEHRGWKWGERDYSQIEPRLMAYYTRAAVFLNDYRTNPKADSHTAVSKAMLAAERRNWDDLTPAQQKHHRNNFGKRVNQTVITGGGKNAIVTKYKVPESEADNMLKTYYKAVPELKPFQRKAAQRFRERGYVLSLLGRRARLDDPDRDYRAMNRLLQVGNADLLKLKMVEIDEYLQESKAPINMLLNCHDALSFQFDPEAREQYDHCKTIMTDFKSESAIIKLDLPIVVDDGEGPNWSVATYGGE